MNTGTVVDRRLARAAAYGTLAKLLGEDVRPLTTGRGLSELALALDSLGEAHQKSLLAEMGDIDEETVATQRVRLFDLAAASPHESSYVPVGAGGHTALLADVAGFYRAVGFRATGQRPDHVIAELEFMSLMNILEAHHASAGRDEAADACADLTSEFLECHVGCWLDRFAAKLVSVAPDAPYWRIVEVAAKVVGEECHERRVDPKVTPNLFVTSEDVLDVDPAEVEDPTCADPGV